MKDNRFPEKERERSNKCLNGRISMYAWPPLNGGVVVRACLRHERVWIVGVGKRELQVHSCGRRP
jgi:hypothetical protein